MSEPKPPACEHECSRRAVLGGAAALACAPVLAQAGCARRIDPARSVVVPAPQNGNLVVPRSAAPELDRVGGSVVLRPAGGCAPVLLANAGDGFLAMQARCPHAGCELTWVQEDKTAECPCHGSRFAGDGTVLSPPADQNVSAYPVAPDPVTGDVIVRLGAGDHVFPALVSGKSTFTVDDRPELQSIGGSVTGKLEGLGRPVVVVRLSQTEVRAFDAVCTHLECRVAWLSRTSSFNCPCHGSRFSQDGQVLLGPAKRGLTRYDASFDGRTVVLSIEPACIPRP
jgi:Rieske Fe-S protein